MKYKNILFDLDGTLLDTLNDLVYALNLTCKELNYERIFTYDDAKTFIGHGILVFATRAFSHLSKDQTKFNDFYIRYSDNYLKYQGLTTKPFFEVKEVLNEFKNSNIRLFVATNKPQPMTDAIIDKCLPNLFIELVGPGNNHKVKPNPEIIDYLCQKYNLNKNETLYVGDSITDMEFAHNANLDFCLCKYGYGFYDNELIKHAKYTIEKFSDIKTIIY